jgi:hypothetical protein
MGKPDGWAKERSVDEREIEQNRLENRKLDLEEKKVKADFWKFFWGSCFAAIAIAAIPPSFQFATAYLEDQRNKAKLELEQQNKKEDRLTKQQEFRNDYIKQFLSTALAQDVELRVRFAEYFANVSPDTEGWTKYLKGVRDNRDKLREQIDKMETELLEAQKGAPKAGGAEARLLRRLDWAYKELGYVEKGRSLVVNPRVDRLEAWLLPEGELSQNRLKALEVWLAKRYPSQRKRVFDVVGTVEGAADSEAALSDTTLMATPK